MKSEAVNQKLIRLTNNNLLLLEKIRKKKQISTLNSTINTVIEDYVKYLSFEDEVLKDIHKIHHDLMLQRKYLNELRKNEFIILNLLNAITYASNLDLPVNHNSKDLQSVAFQNALHNYREYIAEIQTKMAENNKNIENGSDFIDE